MDAQSKKVLSFYEILKCMLGKTVNIICINPQTAFQGILSKLNYTHLVLQTADREIAIYPRNIASVMIVNNVDELVTIEKTMFQNENSDYYKYLNKFVFCLSNKTRWGHSGILTYIGSNYVTIFNEEDCEYFRVPINDIRYMATSLTDLVV
ncbi:MAG: hypothetical protein J6C46_04620 [Clostridia bacterium]|nr:hypothetical protein [Clostridia bacterium]